MRQKKGVPKKRQPTWEEWVSPGESVANKSTYDPVDLTGASVDHPDLTHEAIANVAYSYWEARGCQGESAPVATGTGTGAMVLGPAQPQPHPPPQPQPAEPAKPVGWP